MSHFLQQTDIVPGQSSTATFPEVDQNGGVTSYSLKLPSGKTPSLPANMATTDMLAQLISGNLNLTASDRAGMSLSWDGSRGLPYFTYGDQNNEARSNLLGTTENGIYLTDRGNAVPEVSTGRRTLIQTFTIQNAVDGMIVPFPQQFADDDVYVFPVPIAQINNGMWIMPYCGYWNENRANFTLTRYFVDSSMIRVPGKVKCIAIGSL